MSERRYRTACGDSREILKTLAGNSIDSVVTDPPYDLISGSRNGSGRSNNPDTPAGRHGARSGGFMGLAWDATGIAFDPELWREVKRVVKPGSFIAAFGGARTYHRMVCAMEDAGLIVKEGVVWLHSQGFPKHKNALKPSFEPIVLCQKPFKGSVDRNIEKYTTGGLQIEACRIGRAVDDIPGWHQTGSYGRTGGYLGTDTFQIRDMPPEEVQARCGGKGRWPANTALVHSPDCILVGTRKIKGCPSEVIQGGKDGGGFDVGSSDGTRHTIFQGYGDEDGLEEVERWACTPECAVRTLDDQAGNRKSGKAHRLRRGATTGKGIGYGSGSTGSEVENATYGDSGGPSRFFYCAKASKSEKNAGVPDGNLHPTVKPLSLVRWCVKLVTPPGGTILDLFGGTFTTGCAALLEGFQFLGIEQDPQYYEIGRARLAHAERGGGSR